MTITYLRDREFLRQSLGPSGMRCHFIVSGCMFERIRDRYEKTRPTRYIIKAANVALTPKLLV